MKSGERRAVETTGQGSADSRSPASSSHKDKSKVDIMAVFMALFVSLQSRV